VTAPQGDAKSTGVHLNGETNLKTRPCGVNSTAKDTGQATGVNSTAKDTGQATGVNSTAKDTGQATGIRRTRKVLVVDPNINTALELVYKPSSAGLFLQVILQISSRSINTLKQRLKPT